jgi:hypothetical protein
LQAKTCQKPAKNLGQKPYKNPAKIQQKPASQKSSKNLF